MEVLLVWVVSSLGSGARVDGGAPETGEDDWNVTTQKWLVSTKMLATLPRVEGD